MDTFSFFTIPHTHALFQSSKGLFYCSDYRKLQREKYWRSKALRTLAETRTPGKKTERRIYHVLFITL